MLLANVNMPNTYATLLVCPAHFFAIPTSLKNQSSMTITFPRTEIQIILRRSLLALRSSLRSMRFRIHFFKPILLDPIYDMFGHNFTTKPTSDKCTGLVCIEVLAGEHVDIHTF